MPLGLTEHIVIPSRDIRGGTIPLYTVFSRNLIAKNLNLTTNTFEVSHNISDMFKSSMHLFRLYHMKKNLQLDCLIRSACDLSLKQRQLISLLSSIKI